jgi:hypothetical protein
MYITDKLTEKNSSSKKNFIDNLWFVDEPVSNKYTSEFTEG